jgi:uncharacterized membrane protein YraQ (UPF0718 family)
MGHGHTLEAVAGHCVSHDHLPLAVILHRFPVGLTIWWLLRPANPLWVPLAVLVGLAVSTAVGFFWGGEVTTNLSGQGVAWFQALVAGSLLHVVLHRPHARSSEDCCAAEAPPAHSCHDDHEAPASANSWWAGLGGLAGALLLVLLLGQDFFQPHGTGDHSFAANLRLLALKSAPALLLAYAMAGLMNSFLPRSSIGWMRRGGNWSQALRGMAVGLPFPICSCGVVPLFRTLVQRGAPPAGAIAFLIATPELGMDAVLLSIPLLGSEMTVLRVVAAGLVALVVGAVVGGWAARFPATSSSALATEEPPAARTVWGRFLAGQKRSFGEGLDNTAPWIVLGLVVAALLGPVLEDGWLRNIPAFAQVPLFAVAGIPMYVCASGATPLVAVLLFGGVSPGAALAFLLTGPATNVTTFGVVAGIYGRKLALGFSLSMVLFPILLGYATNWIASSMPGIGVAAFHDHAGSSLEYACLILLGAAFLQSFVRRGPRRFLAEIIGSQDYPLTVKR